MYNHVKLWLANSMRSTELSTHLFMAINLLATSITSLTPLLATHAPYRILGDCSRTVQTAGQIHWEQTQPRSRSAFQTALRTLDHLGPCSVSRQRTDGSKGQPDTQRGVPERSRSTCMVVHVTPTWWIDNEASPNFFIWVPPFALATVDAYHTVNESVRNSTRRATCVSHRLIKGMASMNDDESSTMSSFETECLLRVEEEGDVDQQLSSGKDEVARKLWRSFQDSATAISKYFISEWWYWSKLCCV